MADKPSNGGLNTESAINQLLQAEAQAREQMARCDRQAVTLVEEARHRANRILERAHQRIGQLHSFCSITTGQQVNQLLQPDDASHGNHSQQHYQDTILAAAVEQLAEALSSPDKTPDGKVD